MTEATSNRLLTILIKYILPKYMDDWVARTAASEFLSLSKMGISLIQEPTILRSLWRTYLRGDVPSFSPSPICSTIESTSRRAATEVLADRKSVGR